MLAHHLGPRKAKLPQGFEDLEVRYYGSELELSRRVPQLALLVVPPEEDGRNAQR